MTLKQVPGSGNTERYCYQPGDEADDDVENRYPEGALSQVGIDLPFKSGEG